MARGRDLRVTFLGDDKDLQRAFARGSEGAKKWGKDVEGSSRKAKAAGDGNDHYTKTLERMNVALGQSAHNTKLFKGAMDLVKPAALITGAGLATEAVANLGAGAVAATSALAPLSGALAAYPALGSAAAQAMGTFKLATNDVFKAVGDLNSPLNKTSAQFKKLTPEGQKFAAFVHDDLGPKFLEVQKVAQKGLFPGLEKGARDAAKTLPVVRNIASATAKELGHLAARAGDLVGSKGFGKDLALQGQRNVTWIGRAGTGGLHLANALRNVTIAAGPLVDWMTKLALRGTRVVDSQAKAGRESGRLQRFFKQTRDTMATVVSIGGSLAGAFFNIGKAAAPLGRDILRAVDSNAKAFRAWTDSARGHNAIAGYFQQARAPLFELGRLARDVTKAFFRLGQGDQIAPMLKQIRTQLLPVLENVIGSTTKAFGPHLINALVQVSRLFGALAGSSGPLTVFVDVVAKAAGFMTDLLDHNPALKSMLVSFGGLVAVAKALRFTAAISGVKSLITLFRGLEAAAGGAAAAETAAGAAGATAGSGFATKFIGRAAGPAVVGRLSRVIGAMRIGGGIAVGAFIGQQILAGILHQIPGNLPKRIGDAVEGHGGISPRTTSPIGPPQKGGPSTSTITREYNLFAAAVRHGTQNLAELRALLAKPGHSGFTEGQATALNRLMDSLQRLPDEMAHLRNGSLTNMRDIRRVVTSTLGDIAVVMGRDSARGRRAMTQAFSGARKSIEQLMDDGTISTRQGMKEMARLMSTFAKRGANAASSAIGGYVSDVRSLMRRHKINVGDGFAAINKAFVAEAKAFGLSGGAAKQLAAVQTLQSKGIDPGGRATGGWIGQPGMAGPDQIPIVVGAGEAVLNRYQQGPVEMALRSTYGIGLDDLFSRIQRPHYMATGGKVQKFAYGGVTKPVASLISKLDSMGFHHGSTTGGGHVSGSYHYKGEAVDYGDANNDMQRLWSVVFPMRAKFAELFGPTRTHPGPHLMHFGRGFSDPALQAGHQNHIHMALTGGGALGALVAAAFKKIGLPRIGGPDSPLKGIAQQAITRARSAANRRLESLAGSANLDGFTGGGSNSANMALGKRMMLAAGWPASQWPALRSLWTRESGWNAHARNPSSGAFGIPQALPPGKMGAKAVSGDPAAQIAWGLRYIRGRYGSPSGALAHENSAGWYHRGGFVGGRRFARGGITHGNRQQARGLSFIPKPEDVISLIPQGQIDLAIAAAALTPGADDDIAAQNLALQNLQFREKIQRAALRTHLTPEQRDAYRAALAQTLTDEKGVQDQITSIQQSGSDAADATGENTDALQALTEATQAQADALKALKESIDLQNAFAESITAVTGREALRGLADVVNGNLGFRTSQRVQTPSIGTVARV